MKKGQIANKKVISTFIGSMFFLLVLYCTLSQIDFKLDTSLLKASVYDANTKVVEAKEVLDYNEVLQKENDLDFIKYAYISGYEPIALQYSGVYNVSSNPLNRVMGTQYFGGHKETYYSERVLPGYGLNIPGRHVADDGTIRDWEGYICVAAATTYLSKGTVLMTSMGPAKVYDCGCAHGTIDIYVNW